MSDPLGFLKHSREDPNRRPVEERVRDWRELYLPQPESKTRAQAQRCMDCGVPFCQSHSGCPLGNRIPEWNEAVHEGDWERALKLLHATNNFPEFTGRLCPAPCESACVLSINNSPVSIRVIENSIIEAGFEQGFIAPSRPRPSSGKSVAVVGSGPAGLAAAQQLRRLGHEVVVFEKSDRVGGLLRYGIPEFKMEKRILDRRLKQMSDEGIVFKTSHELGKDITIESLQDEFDAVCLCIGAEKSRDLPVLGRDLRGVHYAMDYLTQQNKRDAGDPEPGEAQRIHAQGKKVIVLGGGDTGSDCVGTARRQGALEIHQLEIMPRPPELASNWPTWPLPPLRLKSSHAHEEGCERDWSIRTLALNGDEHGNVHELVAERVRFEAGQFVSIPGSQFSIAADLVVLALGFTGPVLKPWIGKLPLELDTRGNVKADISHTTSMPGVFAAGDIRMGASLIVWAIAEGRKMAASVDRFLKVGALTGQSLQIASSDK